MDALPFSPSLVADSSSLPRLIEGEPRRVRRRPLQPRPSLRSLCLSNLPAFLSPFPLPSHLSAVLHWLCLTNDPILSSLISDLQHRRLDIDQWERAIWQRVTSHLQSHFDAVFHPIDVDAVEAAVAAERRQRGWATAISLTFGEVPLSSLACILARHVPLTAGDVFADLGSGLGRGVVAALLCHSFSLVVGVELLDCLHCAALTVIRRLPPSSTSDTAVRLVSGDFLDSGDWLSADVVFVNSTCFDCALIERLSERCEQLRLGSRVLTLTNPLRSQQFHAQQLGSYAMSWGAADVWLHCKCQPRLTPP